tara:strand:- start:514 stop:678 length:165 start_codon:yes stop_codon:yes gene_type:complete
LGLGAAGLGFGGKDVRQAGLNVGFGGDYFGSLLQADFLRAFEFLFGDLGDNLDG